ncbi:hypothetical protein AYI70_g2447 [Smittium culicis]|uniref:Uncharacterized protein n=1 Tax=Smittium culicis TaxID=133412 RepID=A0A1R1Y8D2_9FUNG|nr:hypothetical protein AYI70_g2447 [Smittium culicis]
MRPDRIVKLDNPFDRSYDSLMLAFQFLNYVPHRGGSVCVGLAPEEFPLSSWRSQRSEVEVLITWLNFLD